MALLPILTEIDFADWQSRNIILQKSTRIFFQIYQNGITTKLTILVDSDPLEELNKLQEILPNG